MFDVSLVVKNQLGCMFTSIQPDYIKVTNPANTMFASSTNTICGNDSVSFFDLSSSVDPINSWYWDFGSPHFNSTLQNPYTCFPRYRISFHQFNDRSKWLFRYTIFR